MPRVAGDDPYYTFVLKNTRTGKYVHDVQIQLPSVTSIIKATLAKPQLMEWYASKAIDHVSGLVSVLDETGSLVREDLIDMLTDADWLKEYMKEQRLLVRDIVSDAGDRGSEKHDMLERLAKAEQHDPELAHHMAQQGVESEDGWERGISDWWLHRMPVVEAAEKVMLSLRHGYCGSVDLVYNETITDLKTRKAGSSIYESDHIQVGAYKMAWEEGGGSPLRNQTVLLVREDGTWTEEEPTFDTQRVFLGLLDVYTELRKG